MKLRAIITFAIVLFAQESLGFSLQPVVRASGQALVMTCDPKNETYCIQLCQNASRCEINEGYCRNCAGTQNLKLKRIFDSVGTSLIANGDLPASKLIQILKSGTFASLHPQTIYNFSGYYDGDQARAQFRFLCPNLSLTSEKSGIVLVELDPSNRSTKGVIGALCPDEKTDQMTFHKTSSRWQNP